MQITNHVGLGIIDALLETLKCHPLHGKFGLAIITAVVISLVDVTRQTEVCYFDHHLVVKPASVTPVTLYKFWATLNKCITENFSSQYEQLFTCELGGRKPGNSGKSPTHSRHFTQMG